jgi:uncharacterized protein YidB (DUF937 family)
VTVDDLEESGSISLVYAWMSLQRRNTTSKKNIEDRLRKKESLQEIAKAYKRNKRDWLL